jgi:hypothetical protein
MVADRRPHPSAELYLTLGIEIATIEPEIIDPEL